MVNATDVVVRYESARQLVNELKTKRNSMIKDCESIDEIDHPSGFGTVETGTLCLTFVYDVLVQTINDNHGEGYSYEEIMENEKCEGNVCDSCYESYQIKKGPLRDAKEEFGKAKRQLSYLGKKLIKETGIIA